MAADALASCMARSSAATKLTACNKNILVFLESEFEQPAISHR